MLRDIRTWAVRAGAGLLALGLLGLAIDAVSFRIAQTQPGRQRVRVRQVHVDGRRGLLLEAGQGNAVVIIASMLVRARSYLPLVQQLARTRRVIVVELPGSGRGSRLRSPWSVEQYTDWVVAWLERAGMDQAVLIGHSNSGPVAMQVAARSPRIARLILVDNIGSRKPRGIARVVIARVLDGFKEPILDLRGWWHLAFNMVVHWGSFLDQIQMAGTHLHEDDARRVRVPTVVAWGAHDGTLPLDAAVRLRDWLPEARLIVGPGSHDWLITHPKQFVRMVFD